MPPPTVCSYQTWIWSCRVRATAASMLCVARSTPHSPNHQRSFFPIPLCRPTALQPALFPLPCLHHLHQCKVSIRSIQVLFFCFCFFNRARRGGNHRTRSKSFPSSHQHLPPGCSLSSLSTLLHFQRGFKCRADTGARPLRPRDGWRRSPRRSSLNRPRPQAPQSPPFLDRPPFPVTRCPVKPPYQLPLCPPVLCPLSPCPNLSSRALLLSQIRPPYHCHPCQYHPFL